MICVVHKWLSLFQEGEWYVRKQLWVLVEKKGVYYMLIDWDILYKMKV